MNLDRQQRWKIGMAQSKLMQKILYDHFFAVLINVFLKRI